MRSILKLTFGLCIAALFAGTYGCGADSATEPSTDESWDLVRFYQEASDSDGFQDLTLRPSGDLWLETGRRGGASSARGLLAGERLETLARLIDELPLDPYRGSVDCADSPYFLSVKRNGVISTYTTTACDFAAPGALDALRELLDTVITEVREPRLAESDSYRVLASGTDSAIRSEKRVVIETLDGFVRLLRSHDPTGLVAVPQVDFDKQVVVADFTGTRPNGGYGTSLDFVEVSEAGWTTVHISRSEPSPECVVTLAETSPFLFLAIDRPETGFLFEVMTTVTRCD